MAKKKKDTKKYVPVIKVQRPFGVQHYAGLKMDFGLLGENAVLVEESRAKQFNKAIFRVMDDVKLPDKKFVIMKDATYEEIAKELKSRFTTIPDRVIAVIGGADMSEVFVGVHEARSTGINITPIIDNLRQNGRIGDFTSKITHDELVEAVEKSPILTPVSTDFFGAMNKELMELRSEVAELRTRNLKVTKDPKSKG